MRLGTRTALAVVVMVMMMASVFVARQAKGQADSTARSTAALPSYGPAIGGFMDMLSKGKIDDALASVDFFKDQPAAKDQARNRLIAIYSSQQKYNGYDIVAVQRFSPRLQSVSVLAYYNLQPVLFQFDFYHPEATGNQPWIIAGFSIHEKVVEDLKDVPVDYHPTAK